MLVIVTKITHLNILAHKSTKLCLILHQLKNWSTGMSKWECDSIFCPPFTQVKPLCCNTNQKVASLINVVLFFLFLQALPRVRASTCACSSQGVGDYWQCVYAAPQHLYSCLRHRGREGWKRGLLVTCSVTVIVIPPDILSFHLSPSSSLHPWGVFPSCFGSWNLLTLQPLPQHILRSSLPTLKV